MYFCGKFVLKLFRIYIFVCKVMLPSRICVSIIFFLLSSLLIRLQCGNILNFDCPEALLEGYHDGGFQ
ncbi:hypothetical protein L1887_27690 [Cichorium endivia]|nr:hypothetical protein L1887_27690 [Cichorium endivia]